MKDNTTKASNPSLPSEQKCENPYAAIPEGTSSSPSEKKAITIFLQIIKEHKITIEGIPDLNNDGVIDIRDVIIAIKLQIEKDDFKNIK